MNGGWRDLGLMVFGALFGALVGFATYWIGATFVAIQDLMALPPEALPQEFQRPLHTFTYWEIVLVSVGAFIGGITGRYRWRAPGLLAFIGLLALAVGYLSYAIWVTIPQVPDHLRWLSYVLLVAETALLGLVLMAAFYSLDVATRRRWDRLPQTHAYDPEHRPKTALIVPVFNEPFEMLQQTIAHLVAQDYPRDRFVVVVADDSTDLDLRRRTKEYCEQVGAHHVTREQRNGFKAGALNHATKLLAKDIELVGIVDADYWVSPDWVKDIVGHFIDPKIGFIQTPQDYRNGNQSFLTRQYKRAEAYFYHAMMPSRNEESAIIFCGTMGIIRRDALEQVGGFAEDQICEDAEISVRLVAAGWNSLYVDHSYGKGLMPATFDSYKKQFHRWAFGNVKILFTRGPMILRSRMRRRQKIDYIVSNMHWFDGLFVSIVALALIYLGLGPVLGYEAVTHHQKEVALIGLVPTLLVVDSMIRLHLVLKQSGHGRLRDAFLVQGMWFAIKYTNLIAVLKFLVGVRAPFVRTPKDTDKRRSRTRAFFRAMRVTKFETFMGSALMTVAALDAYYLYDAPIGQAVLPLWIGLYGLFFLCAPIYAYASYRTIRPMHFQGMDVEAVRGVQFKERVGA